VLTRRAFSRAAAAPTGAGSAPRNTSFGPLKQINAGVLNIGYAEAGPANGAPLASSGYRVIVPYLRGYGTTRLPSNETARNGQQSAIALDIIALMDALKNLRPLPPAAELGWWYQYYFATERGLLGYQRNTHDFNKLIWKIASPKWNFDDATFDRTAASFNNPDHVGIVIHNYR
jgi:hypothetical protein